MVELFSDLCDFNTLFPHCQVHRESSALYLLLLVTAFKADDKQGLTEYLRFGFAETEE